MVQDKVWVTMKEAQKLLDYNSRGAVYNFCKMYGVRSTKPRGKVYFHQADILAVLDEKAVQMGV